MMRAKFQTIRCVGPSISRLGVSTNRNGSTKVLQPTRQATQPVVQPSVRAMLAAA